MHVLLCLAILMASNTDSRNPFVIDGVEDQGWPSLRGPRYDGRSNETGLANHWPTSGPPVLWTCELGQGYSGFVAWEEKVATQYQTLAGQFVVCLHAATGQTLWRYRYDWPYDAVGVYPGPRATPTYDRGRLYFAAPSGLIGCLAADSGELIWSLNADEQFDGKGTEFGYSCSPTVVDGKVLLPIGGRGASLVALDARNGSLIWKAGDDPASYTPVIPIQRAGRDCVLGYLQNALVCHDLETGERLWRHPLSVGYDEHSAWPIYQEPYLWISGPFQQGSELLELPAGSGKPVRTVWKSRLMSNDVASSVLVNGILYGFDLREAQVKTHRPSRGQFRAIDFLTGTERWSVADANAREQRNGARTDTAPRLGHVTLIEADQKLIMLSDTGELIIAKASPEKYEEVGRVSVLGGEIGWTQPTLHRGRLFVRNHSRAVCVYLGPPEQLDAGMKARSISAASIPQTPYVDWAAVILGIEPEYAFDIPTRQWLIEWYLISLIGVMGISGIVVAVLRSAIGPRMSPVSMRWSFWIVSYVLGALGTTILSSYRGDFVFTWPVPLFVAFQAAIYGPKLQGPSGKTSKWPARLIGMFFIGTCLAYFLICRRFSLVFEWSFLTGFVGGFPFALAGAFAGPAGRSRVAWEVLLTIAAFTAFYWTGVLVLWFKG